MTWQIFDMAAEASDHGPGLHPATAGRRHQGAVASPGPKTLLRGGPLACGRWERNHQTATAHATAVEAARQTDPHRGRRQQQ